jgi:hypothetical protein
VQGDLDRPVPLQDLEERQVRLLIRLFRYEIKISYRLMVMDREDKLYFGHLSVLNSVIPDLLDENTD